MVVKEVSFVKLEHALNPWRLNPSSPRGSAAKHVAEGGQGQPEPPPQPAPCGRHSTSTWSLRRLSPDQGRALARERTDTHPLLQLRALAALDRQAPLDADVGDHGAWDGRWSFLRESEWQLQRELGQTMPCGGSTHDVDAVQAARKEYRWRDLGPAERKLYSEAAVDGWAAYTNNMAVEILGKQKTDAVRRELAQKGELDRILRPRWVLTDKHDGLRTPGNDLPIKASARLVVPGFKDRVNLEGKLCRDAPTGCRLSQDLLLCLLAWNTSWM